jgi:hypothetical protein
LLAIKPAMRPKTIQAMTLIIMAKSLHEKKPTRSNTLRSSTAPAYSSTGLPELAGLPFI